MTLFKPIEFDMIAERKRITRPKVYNKRQRQALIKLCDLFEAGEWQACFDYIHDEKAFPYDEKEGYSEKEHISVEMSDILADMPFANYYTREQIADATQND